MPKVARPEAVSPEEYTDAELLEGILFRNQHFSPYESWKDVNHLVPKLNSLSFPPDSKIQPVIRSIFTSVEWKSISDLSVAELKFFAASLQLLSALCIGRNLWCQRSIRKLLPLDHILIFLETTKEHSSLTKNSKLSPGVAHLHLSVKVMMISILHSCYVDSAFIPPLAGLVKESVLQITSIYQMKNKKFHDVFNEECSMKVFSLFSQEDKNDLLELSLEMTKEDILTCLTNLPLDNATLYQFLKPIAFSCVEDPNITEANFDKKLFETEILSIISLKETLKFQQKQFGMAFSQTPIFHEQINLIKEFKLRLIHLRRSVKIYYAEKAIHAVEQRTFLQKIIMDFIHEEAMNIWSDVIQIPLTEVFASNVFGDNSSSNVLVGGISNKESSTIYGTGDGFNDAEEQIREIRKHIHYMESMFSLIKSLMTRGFFNVEYNCNPVYLDEAGREKLFYSKYDVKSFELTPVVTYDERQIMVMKYYVQPKQEYKRKEKKIGFHLLPFFHSNDPDAKQSHSHQTHQSNEVHGNLKPLRAIIECILKILNVRPGIQLPNRLCNLNEDVKLIDEYFDRQYGFVMDRYHLMQGIMDTKLTCCKVLSNIIDVMQVTTEKELEKIFNTLFEGLLQDRNGPMKVLNNHYEGEADEESHHFMKKLPPASALQRMSSYIQKTRETLTTDETKEFKKQLRLLLSTNLSRNTDLIWHIPELFREETFHVLLHQIYDNNPFLRAEILNLIFRINGRRSELNEMLFKEIKLTNQLYSPTILYLNRQKTYLLDILCHLDRCFDLTLPLLSRKNGNYNIVSGNANLISSKRIPIVIHKIRFYILKLKKLFLNSDEHSGELGLINYCYYEFIENTDLLARRSSTEFLSASGNQKGGFIGAPSSRGVANPFSPVRQQPLKMKLKIPFATPTKEDRNEEKTDEENANPDRVNGTPERKINPSNSSKLNEQFLNPRISVNSTIEQILELPINEQHQKQVIPMNFHKIIIDFVIANQTSFNAESSLYQYYLTCLRDENNVVELTPQHFPSLQVMSYLLMFIRSYVNGPVRYLRAVLNKKFITALFEIRYCVKEATDLLLELLRKPETQMILLEFTEDSNFHSILNDIKFLIQYPEKFAHTSKKRSLFGACPVERLSELLQCLLVTHSSTKKNPSGSASHTHHVVGTFMGYFLAMLSETIVFENKEDAVTMSQSAFQRLLSIGIDIDPQLEEGNENNNSSSSSQMIVASPSGQFVKLDIKRTCHRYQIETGRVTFSRLATNILSDPPMHEGVFIKVKKAYETWKLLPSQSIFQLHLDLVCLIANCAINSVTLQDLYRNAFNSNLSFIFDILFIDKLEIKYAYLQFLNGIWFSRQIDDKIVLPNDFIFAKKMNTNMKALLKTFTQEIRMFLYFINDQEISYYDPKRSQNNVASNGDSGINTPLRSDSFSSTMTGGLSPIMNIMEHLKLAEKYLKNALIPFLIHFFGSNFFEYLNASEESVGATNPTKEPNTIAENDGEQFPRIVSSLVDALCELIVTVGGNFLLEVDTKAICTMLKTLQEEINSTNAAKTIRFIQNRDKLIRTFGGNKPSMIKDVGLEDEIMLMKKKCLFEFIPEVDQFAVAYGYSAFDHLMKTPTSSYFLLGREVQAHNAFGFGSSVYPSNDDNNSGLNDDSSVPRINSVEQMDARYQLVINPLNCETFRYTEREISKLLVGHCKFQQPDRFHHILKLMERITNNQEDSFKHLLDPRFEELEKEFVDHAGDGSFVKWVSASNRKSSTKVNTTNPARFSEYQFKRWTKYGGLLIGLIFDHLQYSLLCYKGEKSFYSSSADLDELSKCNSYWVHTMTKGLLKSNINFLFEKYADQTETQLKQLEVEGNRLCLIQDVIRDLGAVNLIVRQLSIPQAMLAKVVNLSTIDSIYSIAIEFGGSLNENGNGGTQDLFIESVESEFALAKASGYENHSFVGIIRALLTHYYVLFQTRDGLTEENVSKAVKLLRFLQLLCERHNEKAQKYFGGNKIVMEVAIFVNEVTVMLSSEFSELFLSEDELMPRDQPNILGFRRSVIRWINPLPDSFRFANNNKTRTKKVKSPNTNSNTNLNASSSGRIHPVDRSPSKDETSTDGDPDEAPSPSASPKKPNNNNNSSNHTMPQTKPKFVDINRLRLLCELVNAGFETLTEFNQGPRPEIQLMIARTGVTSEMNNLFKFFGAFHLFTKVDFETKTYAQKKSFHKLFENKVKNRITCESLLPVSVKGDQTQFVSAFESSHDVHWIGNDPLAVFMILSSMNEDRNDSPCQSSKKRGGGGGGHHHHNNMSADDEQLSKDDDEEGGNNSAHSCFHCCSSCSATPTSSFCWNPLHTLYEHLDDLTGNDGDILDLERRFHVANFHRSKNPFNTENIAEWAEEKDLYMEYCKRKSKMSKILAHNYYESISNLEEVLVDLEGSCLKFLSSLIEGVSAVDKENIEIPMIIFDDISKEHLICNMANYWYRYLNYESVIPEDAKKGQMECYERSLAYNYHILISQFLDLNVKEITTNLNELLVRWAEETDTDVDEYIGRIEVRSPVDSKSLVVTYFPIPELIKTYWYRTEIEEFRDHILFPTTTGTRDSIDEKVKNFLRDGQKLIITLRHLESLDEIIAPQSIFLKLMVELAHNYKRWNMISFLLTATLNLLLVISIRMNEKGSNYEIHGHMYRQLIAYCGWVHLGSTSLTVCSFMVMFGWLYVKMGFKSNENNQYEFHGYFISRFIRFLYYFGLLGRSGSLEVHQNNVTVQVWTMTAATVHLFSHAETIYFMALLIFSLLGNLRNPLFFALCLMEVLRLSKLMLYVSRAFTVNIGQVFATIGLAAILLYLFATFSFSDSNIRNKYYFNGIGIDGCFSLQECFRMHLDYGLLMSVFWHYDTQIKTVEGEIFNFLYNFIMQIVIPGLISGIIIDTFSQMRQDKQEIEDDVYNTCFICNIDREDFESMNISFEDHIRHDHNLWKYLWFNIYLFEKDITEFDGIESYCHEILEKADFTTRWLPIKMARSLSKMRDKYDLFTIYSKISTLQTMIDRFTTNMKGDLYKTEKHIRESIKEEMTSIEKDTKDILAKLEKRVKGSDANTPGGAARVGGSKKGKK
jgi:hypothetical protein